MNLLYGEAPILAHLLRNAMRRLWMKRRFSIERDRDWSLLDAEPASSAAETVGKPFWSFLGDFEALAGECAEPDPQFFVESWTLGLDAAMSNFEQRQRANARPAADSYSFSPTAEFLQQNACFEELSAAARVSLADQIPPREAEPQFRDSERDQTPAAPMTLARARRILGVAISSTRTEIKAAYRRLAANWHPDHMGWSTPEARRQANEQMMLLNEAYRLLR